MDYDRTKGDRGLPEDTSTEPVSMRPDAQPGKPRYPLSPNIANPGVSCKLDSRQNNRKRKGSFDQSEEEGLPLINRSTKHGRPLDEVLRDERNGDKHMMDFSDYSGDDEKQRSSCPRKMPRNDRKSQGPSRGGRARRGRQG